MITVLIADDQELVRSGLRALLERDPDIRVVAEAINGREALFEVSAHRPDVVLMDIRMPELDGLEATRRIVADPSLGGVRIVVLTTFDEDETVLDAIRNGAAGFLLKDISPDELRRAVHVVAGGEALLSSTITSRVMRWLADRPASAPRPDLLTVLTEREREVLRHIGLGESNDEIGQNLFISPGHRSHLCEPPAEQAGGARPVPARHRRLRKRTGHPGRPVGLTAVTARSPADRS